MRAKIHLLSWLSSRQLEAAAVEKSASYAAAFRYGPR